MKRDKAGKFAQAWVGETKQAVKLSLTNTAWQLLAEQAKKLGISRSELVERYARQSHHSYDEGYAVNAGPNKGKHSSKAEIGLADAASTQSPAAQIAILQQENRQLHDQIAHLQQQIDGLRSQNQQLCHSLQQEADTQTNEHQWLEAVLNLLPTPLILVDPQQYCVTFSNQAANAIAGVDLAKDVGATYNEDYHCIDTEGRVIPPEQTPAARAAQGEKIVGTEISWHTPVGTFPLLVYADTVPAMHDRPATSVIVFQDISKRKQIEEQLRESQRFIQQVADATPGILYIYDLIEQRNVYINRQIGEILGYTTDEIQAMGNLLSATLLHPEDLATFPEHIKRFSQVQDGELVEREYRMRHANGEWRWLWSRDLIFSRTETNAPHQVIGIAHDITARKQAELDLQAMQERLSLVLQATNDAIYDRHLKTGTVWWNPAYDQLVGKRPVEGNSSQWWVERLHPDDRNRVVNSFEAALAQADERWSAEYRYQRADGNYANVIDRTYILRDAAGQAERYLGAISDVTHLKQVEQDLKQTQERLQLALSSACMVAWDIDLQANQVVCSPNAMEVWGIQAGSLQTFLTAVHPEDRQHLIEALERAKTGEEDYHVECRMMRCDRTTGWFNSQGRVYFNEHGRAIRMVGVSADVSERRQAELAAAKAADRTARLQTITAALSEALTPKDVAAVVVEQALAALGACRGLVMLLTNSGEELELLGSVGYAPEALANWQRLPVTTKVPLTDVLQTEAPIFLQSVDEAIAAYPQFATVQTMTSRAIAAIPLIAENKVLGALGIGFTEAHSMNEEDRAFVLALARHCAQAIRRAQLYQAGQEAREQAEASEQRFRCLAESIPQIVWVAQGNGFTEYYNQRWFQYTGLNLEESQNANGSFRHPDDHAHFGAAWIKASTNKEIFQAEQRIRRVDGVYRWHLTRAFPLLNEQGEIEKWFGTCTDIDNRKRMEQTQRFLAQASQTFVAASLDLQTILDTVARLSSELTGDVCVLNLLADDQQSLEHVAFYHADPDVRAFVGNLLERYPRRINEGIGGRVMQTGEPLLMPVKTQAEFAAVIKPEYQRYLERFQVCSTLLVPLKVQGSPIGLLSLTRHAPADPHTEDDLNLFQDLANRAAMAIANARLYAAEQRARTQAEAANRTKDEFLAVLSHELRTPMNPILGWTGLLRQGNLDANRTAIALETIERNAKLQVQLIEDLLDISRILQGKLVLTPSPVNLVSIIDAAIGTVRLAADAKHIQIHTHIATDVSPVLGDAARLQQVVWNLLSNAVKFTLEHGQIDIQLSTVGAYTQICVKDTGQGIRAEFLPFVFDTFRQADSSITRAFGGLGLGLAIVHHIVELHGGTTQAESPGEGQGATFTIQLPILSTTETPPAEIPSTHHRLALQGVKVLAVDDEVDNLELVTFILEQAGASVLGISSASTTLPLLSKTKPDILVLDIGMPEIDGYTLLQQVRALPLEAGGQIPAIALTAYAGEVDYQRAMAAGYNRHLAKPIEPEVLIGAIADLVHQRR